MNDAVVHQSDEGVVLLCGRCGDALCDDGQALTFPAAIDAIEYAYRFECWTFDHALGKWCCGNHVDEPGSPQ